MSASSAFLSVSVCVLEVRILASSRLEFWQPARSTLLGILKVVSWHHPCKTSCVPCQKKWHKVCKADEILPKLPSTSWEFGIQQLGGCLMRGCNSCLLLYFDICHAHNGGSMPAYQKTKSDVDKRYRQCCQHHNNPRAPSISITPI